MTTSEGEAYAMFFSLVVSDRNRFEKLVSWTEANLAQGDLTAHLPAWSWGKAPDGTWRVLDANPASDADLWMAYSLCEAGRLWDMPRYSGLGRALAKQIAAHEVVLADGVGTVLIPGPSGFHPSDTAYYVNPSYMPPMLLAYFAHIDKSGPWMEIAGSLPLTLNSPGHFAMDWVAVSDAGVQASAPPAILATLPAGQTPPTPVGSYDAIRVYLWAGMSDPKTPQLDRVMSSLRGMALYLKTNPNPPEKVDPNGNVLASPNWPLGFSAAVIPYLNAQGLKGLAEAQKTRLAGELDPKSGLYGKQAYYYDQNLALFEQGSVEKRFVFNRNGELQLRK